MNKKIKILLLAAIIIFAVGCSSTVKTNRKNAHNFIIQPGEVISLIGDNGYQGIANYFSPNGEGVLSRLSLLIYNDDGVQTYDMVSVPAASGAKFSTKDSEFVMWESRGEFSFYRGDAETLISTFKKNPHSYMQGRIAVVELAGNTTTGYTWVYTLSSEGIIREILNEYVVNASDKGIAGSGGKFIFAFEAAKAGETEIIFSYLRSWEEGVPAAETAAYTVTADKNKNLSFIRK